MKLVMLFLILIPALSGALLPFLRLKRRGMCLYTGLILGISAVLSCVLLFSKEDGGFTLFYITDILKVTLRADAVSRVFLAVAAIGFLLAGVYAFRYTDMEEKEGSFKESTFYSFYLLSLAALFGMDLSANLVGMYFFFEMITLLSMPLVLFERSPEAIGAALKYLFYSIAGAFLALAAIFTLGALCDSLDFTPGGFLSSEIMAEHRTLVLVMGFLGILGFSAKAGMYPLHGWLPSAHPVAPSPASAVLSGIIAKAGVLAIIRLLFYAIGPAALSGTWVQTALLVLSLLTVFMGSMMAYREKNLKKRLAYSSVSQISYVLFGLFLMTADGFTGALLQVLSHAAAKITLFLAAGSFIYHGIGRSVEDLRGIGRKMPLTMIAFTSASLSLVGIPPFAGFISKWFLAEGALKSGLFILNWAGPAVLLVSALLTAGYLFPVITQGFFPGKDFKAEKKGAEGGLLMLIPLLVLAVLSLLVGLFGGALTGAFRGITDAIFAGGAL